MTPSWGPTPQFKLELTDTGYTWENDQALQIRVSRPENNVSYLTFGANDEHSKHYLDAVDTLDAVTLSLRYGADAWTKVFSGVITTVCPQIGPEGEMLVAGAFGLGQAIAKTHCNTSYGLESLNPTLETPKEIWDDVVDNYINKAFGGAATGYSITTAKIADIHNDIDVTCLASPYLDNFIMINRVCDIVTAHVGAGVASCHWFVDPDGNLFINTLGAHENNASGWPTYWNGSQAASTIEVTADMLLYNFRKNIEQYANKILFCSDLRKPASDYWTEDSGGAALWGTDATAGVGEILLTDDAAEHKVGSHSLKFTIDVGVGATDPQIFYPSTEDAAWNLSNIGSAKTIPVLRFYLRQSHAFISVLYALFTNRDVDYFYHIADPATDLGFSKTDEWVSISFPVGDYYQNYDSGGNPFVWTEAGAPDWSDINGFQILFSGGMSSANVLRFDDLHFSGKVIREAYNSTEIAAHHEYQKVVLNGTALDDSMSAADDTGVIAMLAKAELLRHQARPTVGTVKLPLAVDLLPGQLIHTHAAKQSDGTFRIDGDFRVKELVHDISLDRAATTVNLTSDVYNSHAFAAPTMRSILQEYVGALGHKEAKDLKGSSIDALITRLSVDYG